MKMVFRIGKKAAGLREDYDELDGFVDELIELSGIDLGNPHDEKFFTAQDLANAFMVKYSIVPEGWQLVPIRISEVMLGAAGKITTAYDRGRPIYIGRGELIECWDTFLQAAPKYGEEGL